MIWIKKIHLGGEGGGGGHGGKSATSPLRHSCQLSQDKNRTKQNLESGKCRLFFSSVHLHQQRSVSSQLQICKCNVAFFPHEQVWDLLTGVVHWLTRAAAPTAPFPFPYFFHNRNNKQTVKRFLIAISNSKTIHHWPISHSSPMQFMAYLVVFISSAPFCLGGVWISIQLHQILNQISTTLCHSFWWGNCLDQI